MSSNYLQFIFILINIHQISSQPSPNHKNIQLIGHTRYISLQEEAQRDFCGNFWCTNDAFYIFTKSSQYVGVDPCVDFKNFTVNHVEEVDHPDDRQRFRGFQSIVHLKYLERLRKVVAAKIDPVKDNRVVKVMKNTFQKCLKSPHLTRHLNAHKDMIKHLQSLGGSPYLSKHTSFNLNLFDDNAVEYFYNRNFTLNINENISDDLWNENNFNLKKIFENEPFYAMWIFFDLEVKRCEEILCLIQSEDRAEYIENEEYVFEAFKELFRELDDSYRHPKVYKNFLIDEVFKPTVGRYQEYLKNREEIWKSFKNAEPMKISIKDLREKLAKDFDIDWLEIINSQLLERSKVTENDEILIKNGGIEMLQELLRNLVTTDKKVLADTFVTSYLYAYRTAIILRFHNQEEQRKGLHQGSQRWIRCIVQYNRYFMDPALIYMYEQWRPIWDRTVGDFDRDLIDERVDIVGNAEKFIREAVDEFKIRFKTGTNLKASIAIDVLNKLNSLKIVISLQSNIFTTKILEEFYENLQLNGNEEFLESILEMQKNYRRILNEPRDSWQRQITQMISGQGGVLASYNIEDGNILYIPPVKMIYPNYHPLRPRFFNMVTIFIGVIGAMDIGVQNYIKKKFNLQSNKDYITGTAINYQISYEHYSNWLKTHTDLIIGANLLTHRQLFWVADAVEKYARFPKGTPKSYEIENQLQQEYFHVWHKNFKGFQEAFQCNITDDEWKSYLEYEEKYYEI